jgi:hypothetical protein
MNYLIFEPIPEYSISWVNLAFCLVTNISVQMRQAVFPISENVPKVSLAGMINSRTAHMMPKRKRGHYGRAELDPTQELELKKGELARKIVHGKKVLHRALKTAKGFERQKLGKRIKLATENQDGVEAGRLQRELDALKVTNLFLCGRRMAC